MLVKKQPRPQETSMLKRRSPAVQLAPLAGMQQHNRSTPSQLSGQQLTPQNVLYLQRTIGNAAVQQMLADQQTDKPTIQPQLKVGPANDEFEREADDISRQVVQRASTSRVQRATTSSAQVGPEGGTVGKELEGTIHKSKSGGSSIPDGVRNQIEPKLGADLSNVKVHTDSQSADLNRQLGAKAFTHKNHIFYGAGQSPSDVKLTAHEAVHTVQQGATTQRKSDKDTLQRVYQHPDNSKFYSDVLPRQEITNGNGVITASATGGLGGGHTILVFEYLDANRPKNKKIDLTAGGGTFSSGIESGSLETESSVSAGTTLAGDSTSDSTGSGSSGTGSIQINIGDASKNSMGRLATAQKRSWVVTKEQINKGLAESLKVQDDMIKNKTKYKYKLFGRSFFAKNPMNCASFGERVLTKAGIKASATSWMFFGGKTPSKLASGRNVGYTPDENFPPPQQIVAPPQVDMGESQKANPGEFDHIPQQVYRNVTFLEDKILPGDSKEFNYKGDPDQILSFKTSPTGDYDLPLRMFKIIVFGDKGLAQLIPPVGECKLASAWVKLSDLFSSTGTILTA